MVTAGSLTKTVAISGQFERLELKVVGTPTPGMLCLRSTTAGSGAVHASAGQSAEKIFALEDDLQGVEIDTAYTATAQGQFGHFHTGARVNALLANGQVVVVGQPVQSNGDGYLALHTAQDSPGGDIAYNDAIVGYAEEALDMSDSSSVDPASQRFIVRIA